MSIFEAARDWLSVLSAWIGTDDRANMVFGMLALALLLELAIRVVLRLLADQRLRRAATKGSLRLGQRLRRSPPDQR